MCTSLRILQQNVNGDEMTIKALKLLSTYDEADIIAVQDLICTDGNYDQAMSPFRVYTSSKIGNTALAAIGIVNSDLKVCDVEELETKYSVCVCIDSQLGDLYIINVCLPASEELNDALTIIDHIVTQLAGEMFLLTINTNAKSAWWSCRDRTDTRGSKIEKFILKHQLCVLNYNYPKDRNSEPWTFKGHTDVTLSSSNVAKTVMKWVDMGEADGNRVARTDLMLQDLTYRPKMKKYANKYCKLSWMVEEESDTIFEFEDEALTSFEGSTSRWNETDIDKIEMKMSQSRLTEVSEDGENREERDASPTSSAGSV